MLPLFGAACAIDGPRLCIDGGQTLHGAEVHVPRDLSAAAFFLVAALIAPNSELRLPGVGINERRDGILRILLQMGANIEVESRPPVGAEPVADLSARSSALRGTHVDAALIANAIDEFPVLCIAAACARGDTTIDGIGELRVKESDRVAAMAEGLATLGVPVTVGDDSIRITGHRIGGGTVRSRRDHRIAMAFAVAALAARRPITVEGTRWVATSFPGFAERARQAGLPLRDA